MTMTMIATSLLLLTTLMDGSAAFSPSSSNLSRFSHGQRVSQSFFHSSSSIHASFLVDENDDRENLRPPMDDWSQLEVLSDTFQQQSGRIWFHEKELVRQDFHLTQALKQQHNVQFDIPSTWEDAYSQFTSQPQTQLLLAASLVSIVFRWTMWPTFGVSDLAAMVLTKAAYQVQEYAYHRRNYHGYNEDDNDNHDGHKRIGKSFFPFAYHDQHHSLPYYHVALEPTLVCASFAASVTAMAVVVAFLSNQLGLLDASASPLLLDNNNIQQLLLPTIFTVQASFLVCSVHYLAVHYLAHSKVPLKGWLQQARENHVQHHLNHEVNYNMAGQALDELFQTHHRHR